MLLQTFTLLEAISTGFQGKKLYNTFIRPNFDNIALITAENKSNECIKIRTKFQPRHI